MPQSPWDLPSCEIIWNWLKVPMHGRVMRSSMVFNLNHCSARWDQNPISCKGSGRRKPSSAEFQAGSSSSPRNTIKHSRQWNQSSFRDNKCVTRNGNILCRIQYSYGYCSRISSIFMNFKMATAEHHMWDSYELRPCTSAWVICPQKSVLHWL